MSIKDFVLDLFFPSKCVFCRTLLTDERSGGVCPKCAGELPYTSNPRGNTHGEFFDFCLAPLYYRDNVRLSVRRFKFFGLSSYAKAYAHMIAETVKSEPDAVFDVISYAPVSKKRLKKRGYDQSRLIAEALSSELNAPCVRLLDKKRNAPPQSTLKGGEKRRANVSGAYGITAGAEVSDRRILLIDDVITSGATLSECSRTLLMNGADSVICAVLARAE